MKCYSFVFTITIFLFSCQQAKQSNSSTDTSKKVDTTSISVYQDKNDKQTIGDTLTQDVIRQTWSDYSRDSIKSIKSLAEVVDFDDLILTFEPISKQDFHNKFRYSNRTEKDFKMVFDTSRANFYNYFSYVDYLFEKQSKSLKNRVRTTEIKRFRKRPDDKIDTIINHKYFFGDNFQYRVADDTISSDLRSSYILREIIDLRKESFVVFLGSYWEGASYQFFSEHSGRQYVMNGIPQISPDSNYIFTTPFDIGTYFNFDGVELWKVEGNVLKKVVGLGIDADLGTAWRSYWLNNNTIYCELRKNKPDNEGMPNYNYQYCKITLQKK